MSEPTCDYCDSALPSDPADGISIDGGVCTEYCSITCAVAHLTKLLALKPSEEESIIGILTKREDLRPYVRKP